MILRFLHSASGKFKVAALTNNFAAPTSTDPKSAKGKERSLQEELDHLGLGSKAKKLKGEFDLYIESAVVGMR